VSRTRNCSGHRAYSRHCLWHLRLGYCVCSFEEVPTESLTRRPALLRPHPTHSCFAIQNGVSIGKHDVRTTLFAPRGLQLSQDESDEVNPYMATTLPHGPTLADLRPSPQLRIVSLFLAMSGLVFAPVAWILPIFWPGYLIWIGWIAITCGSSRVNRPWFWASSLLWNLLITAMLLLDTDWTFQNKAWGYFHARAHSISACLLSLIALLVALGARHAKTESKPSR
jgi:hypothetical protein